MEQITAFRCWTLEGTHLQSVSSQHIWNTRTFVALCSHGCQVPECLKNHQCSCGIYSKKTLDELLEEFQLKYRSYIYGKVLLQGTILDAEKGYRSESATILEIYTDDIKLGQELKSQYFGIKILSNPRKILDMQLKFQHERDTDNWRVRNEKEELKRKEKAALLESQKARWPGGYKTEKERLAKLLVNKSKEELVAFAHEYANNGEWEERCWIKKENSRKAKTGEFVFVYNDSTRPFIFIGSSRDYSESSMRYLIGEGGELVRKANIRKWNEEEMFKDERQVAIEEWK